MPSTITLLDVTLLGVGVYIAKRYFTSKAHRPLPPGPKGLPLVGNVMDMPTQEGWKTFAEWGKTHGDIMSVNILGQIIVILNSAEHCYALLDKRGSIYSNRPHLVMGGELVGWNETIVLTPYGERFKRMRKMFHKAIGSRANLDKQIPLMELESHRLLRRIFENPTDPSTAVRKTAGAVILMITYGYQPKEINDEIVVCVDEATDQFNTSTEAGAFLVDVFPMLKHTPSWVPGASFQRKAAAWRETTFRMAALPFDFVKRQIAAGTAVSSMVSELLSEKDLSAEDEDVVRWASASLYSGGADTTVSATDCFFLAMTLCPDVQAKAHAEIDRVIGSDRLPGISDRRLLPYVSALVKEVFRWNPVGPLGIPHRLTADDVYEGYFIPKGTLVLSNIWKILHDERTYDDPLAFRPERFLESPGKAPEMDPTDVVFGFGRRVCPGIHLADNSVWLNCARSLAVFNVTKALDEQGCTITPVPKMTSGAISHPEPFRCDIKPRSPKHEALITAVEFSTA